MGLMSWLDNNPGVVLVRDSVREVLLSEGRICRCTKKYFNLLCSASCTVRILTVALPYWHWQS